MNVDDENFWVDLSREPLPPVEDEVGSDLDEDEDDLDDEDDEDDLDEDDDEGDDESFIPFLSADL